jgi:hypothetical protein
MSGHKPHGRVEQLELDFRRKRKSSDTLGARVAVQERARPTKHREACLKGQR